MTTLIVTSGTVPEEILHEFSQAHEFLSSINSFRLLPFSCSKSATWWHWSRKCHTLIAGQTSKTRQGTECIGVGHRITSACGAPPRYKSVCEISVQTPIMPRNIVAPNVAWNDSKFNGSIHKLNSWLHNLFYSFWRWFHEQWVNQSEPLWKHSWAKPAPTGASPAATTSTSQKLLSLSCLTLLLFTFPRSHLLFQIA